MTCIYGGPTTTHGDPRPTTHDSRPTTHDPRPTNPRPTHPRRLDNLANFPLRSHSACLRLGIRSGFHLSVENNWFCTYYATRLPSKFAPIFHPIRNKTKTNQDSLARVFPRFASATCNYFNLIGSLYSLSLL